jgi:hypothetical protein
MAGASTWTAVRLALPGAAQLPDGAGSLRAALAGADGGAPSYGLLETIVADRSARKEIEELDKLLLFGEPRTPLGCTQPRGGRVGAQQRRERRLHRFIDLCQQLLSTALDRGDTAAARHYSARLAAVNTGEQERRRLAETLGHDVMAELDSRLRQRASVDPRLDVAQAKLRDTMLAKFSRQDARKRRAARA